MFSIMPGEWNIINIMQVRRTGYINYAMKHSLVPHFGDAIPIFFMFSDSLELTGQTNEARSQVNCINLG